MRGSGAYSNRGRKAQRECAAGPHNRTCTKFRTALGASLGQSSISRSPKVVRRTTCRENRSKTVSGHLRPPAAALAVNEACRDNRHWRAVLVSSSPSPCPLWAAQVCILGTSRSLASPSAPRLRAPKPSRYNYVANPMSRRAVLKEHRLDASVSRSTAARSPLV